MINPRSSQFSQSLPLAGSYDQSTYANICFSSKSYRAPQTSNNLYVKVRLLAILLLFPRSCFDVLHNFCRLPNDMLAVNSFIDCASACRVRDFLLQIISGTYHRKLVLRSYSCIQSIISFVLYGTFRKSTLVLPPA